MAMGANLSELEALAKRVSNWNRWGSDDERGTLNYITDSKRVDAATLVRKGKVFSLAIPLNSAGPQTGASGRVNPIHLMTATGSDPREAAVSLGGTARYTDDFIMMPLQCGTQWDSLAHVYYGDTLYNGFPASTVSSYGASRAGIDKVHKDFVSRGVLLDIAGLKMVDVLDPEYAISIDDLEAAERQAGLRVESGDILLVRTGLMSTYTRTSTWDAFQSRQAGLHYDTLPWLHERGVAAVAADTAVVEAVGTIEGVMVPFHMVALRDMGLFLGEYWDLEELSVDCAADGVYEFFLVAQALPVTGAVGSPINPIAMK